MIKESSIGLDWIWFGWVRSNHLRIQYNVREAGRAPLRTIKDQAEGVEETAKRLKALAWTREEGLWIGDVRLDSRARILSLAS